MHHQPVIHEVEAVGLCLIRVTDHLVDCKRSPASWGQRSGAWARTRQGLQDSGTGTGEQRVPPASLGFSFPIGGLGMGARHKRPGMGREGLRPTFPPTWSLCVPRPPGSSPTHSAPRREQGSRRCARRCSCCWGCRSQSGSRSF